MSEQRETEDNKRTRGRTANNKTTTGFRDYAEVRDTLLEFGFTAHIRSRGEEAQALKKEAGFRARRWVVERTHSWMNRFRCILVRWEKKAENYAAFLHFACGLIAFRASGLFG